MLERLFYLLIGCLIIHLVAADPSNLRRSAAAAPQNTIIPILECIDKHNKAYFSYENGFGDVVGLGKSAQNILSPLDIAPITHFVDGSGPAFPLSAQVSLAGFENSTFNWNLINYFLTFNITPELACPTVFNITLKFNYEVEGALGFFPPDYIVTKFAQVAGISDSRVTLLGWTDTGPTAKRVLDTADLTVEIQLTDGNSTNSNATDPTAAEVVNQFVNGTKTQELTQQLQTEFSPKYSNLTEFTPKSDPTPSIYGQVRPPTSVPSADPVAPMAENVPNSPVSSPKPKTTLSSATLLSFNITLLLVTIMISLVKIGQM